MRRTALTIALSAAIASLPGCGGGGGEAPPVERAPAGLDAGARAAMERGARAFAEDVRQGRADSVADRVDLDAIVRGVCRGTGAPESVREDFSEGFATGLGERHGGLLSDYLGGEFRFLRLVEEGGSTQMLFRAWDEERGIDYLRCAVDRPSEEGWEIVDLYSYTAGESFTDSLRRTYLPVLAGGGEAKALRERFAPLAEVVDKVAAGEFEAARDAFGNLPAEQRGERFARTLELQFLAAIDEAADDYAAAVESFREAYPEDPSLPLRLLEVHSIRGEHEAALRRIDEVEKGLGGDPFLHFLRAAPLSALGRGREAIDGLEEAIRAEPAIEALRWALVQAALAEAEHEVVAATLRTLIEDFEYQLGADELRATPAYGAFAESAEGLALLEELAAQPAGGRGDCN